MQTTAPDVTCVLRMSRSASTPVLELRGMNCEEWTAKNGRGQNAARGSNDARSRAKQQVLGGRRHPTCPPLELNS